VDDKRHLYNKAKITLNQAYKALDNKEWYAYRTYVDGCNELLAETPQSAVMESTTIWVLLNYLDE
jgi:hypothetical protein